MSQVPNNRYEALLLDKMQGSSLLEIVICAVALVLVFAFALRMIARPIWKFVSEECTNIIPAILKELGGNAGRTGKANITISILTFILIFVALMKPTFKIFTGNEDLSDKIFIGILISIAVFVFMTSIFLIKETDKFSLLYQKKSK